ncbi:helix-turn-helix domain-containing protein [Stappia sp.]|uniref:helix-turn-helix domain-containing protein n=1 Tax=Stappia sp. TaxID=1870903 RepID=UPI003A9A4E41
MTETGSMWSEARDGDSIGGRIRRAREAANFSGAQLARRLGVKTATVTAWEGGRSEPRANRLTMLAGFLGVSPTWLLYGLGEAPVESPLASELAVVASTLKLLRENHERTGEALDRIEAQIAQIARIAGAGKEDASA